MSVADSVHFRVSTNIKFTDLTRLKHRCRPLRQRDDDVARLLLDAKALRLLLVDRVDEAVLVLPRRA